MGVSYIARLANDDTGIATCQEERTREKKDSQCKAKPRCPRQNGEESHIDARPRQCRHQSRINDANLRSCHGVEAPLGGGMVDYRRVVARRCLRSRRDDEQTEFPQYAVLKLV